MLLLHNYYSMYENDNKENLKKGTGNVYEYKIRKFRSVIAYVLILAIMFGILNGNNLMINAKTTEDMTTLFLVDNTSEQWVKNDNAVIELVDNSNGHIHYNMVKQDDRTWKVQIPESANNITFNRYDAGKTIQWNSWSAGGRDNNNAYYVDGSEYGHWENIEYADEENYFHAGDIVYLDISEFTLWKNDNALMYVNFSNASKEQNGGKDINISVADSNLYNPKVVDNQVEENLYAYVISFEDEGKTELRFWRGNSATLWNYSVVLSYEDYKNGKNCISINDWDNSGTLSTSEFIMDIELDSDGDGLPDYYELIYGFDKNSIDSDGDGLSDFQEVHLTNSNPLKYDSLAEGICDGDMDNDNDGLTNKEEVVIGTNPNNKDTDGDGLTDGYEYKELGSDPDNEDTDGDTLIDGDEISLGFSPLLVDTDYNGIMDCDEKIYQNLNIVINNNDKKEVSQVSVSFEGTGYINSTTTIEDLYGKDTFVSDTVGLVGVPVEIKSSSKFDTANISFYLNNEINDIPLSDLLIVWYDEENDRFVEQETIIDEENMTVSAIVNHFSKYMIVDKKEWFRTWKTEIDYTSSIDNIYDTVIAIDCSGSMSSNDPNFEYTVRNTLYPGSSYTKTTCYRKLAAENFVEAQKSNDNTGIVLFDSTANVACGLTDSVLELKSAIGRIYSSGGASFNSAINTSLNMLLASVRNSEKMILLVSDGESSINDSYINVAKENGITINTVYIGKGADNSLLQSIAHQTGGQYFKAVTADELIEIYSEIIIDQKIDSTDSDNDGIPDIFEISGMRLSNGRIIYTDPTTPDTDGDGLSDGEEIKVTPTFWVNTIFDELNIPFSISAYIFEIYSDPNRKDTDGDGISDYFDTHPKEITFSEEDLNTDASKLIKENASYIINAASYYDIDSRIVAAAIFTEQSLNVDWKDKCTDWLAFYWINTSVGIGQVRLSTAEFLEEEGYVPKTSSSEGGWNIPIVGHINGTETMSRCKRLEDNEFNTIYVAAYLKYFVDEWNEKFPTISSRCDILCTLYNIGHESTKANSNPKSNNFGNYANDNYDMMYILLFG